MAYLEQKKVEGVGGIPIFQKVLETNRGGFSLDASGLTEGDVLRAGTPIAFDEETRIATKANLDGTDVGGLLYDDVIIEEGAPIAVVVRGTVYFNRIEDLLGDAGNQTAIADALPLIIFSKSF